MNIKKKKKTILNIKTRNRDTFDDLIDVSEVVNIFPCFWTSYPSYGKNEKEKVTIDDMPLIPQVSIHEYSSFISNSSLAPHTSFTVIKPPIFKEWKWTEKRLLSPLNPVDKR